MISENLYTFLREWLDWVESGAEKHQIFERDVGLCFIYDWWYAEKFNTGEVHSELEDLFQGEEFPFGKEDYYSREEKNTQHLCPKRLAWVKQKINQYEEVILSNKVKVRGCPLCAGVAHWTKGSVDLNKIDLVECGDCGLKLKGGYLTGSALEFWNFRAANYFVSQSDREVNVEGESL